MKFKTILGDLLPQIDLNNNGTLKAAINFSIRAEDGTEEFAVLYNEGELTLEDGHADGAIGLLCAQEKSITAILDMGINPAELLFSYAIPDHIDRIAVPEINSSIFLYTETEDAWPLAFNIYEKDRVVHITEGEDMDCLIKIRIKASYLPRILDGDINLTMALLRGKIKVTNKRELIRLLGKFGLNF